MPGIEIVRCPECGVGYDSKAWKALAFVAHQRVLFSGEWEELRRCPGPVGASPCGRVLAVSVLPGEGVRA